MSRTLVQSLIAALAVFALGGCTRSAKVAAQGGAIAIAVTENGFEPAEVTVEMGKPVTLVITRKTDKTCAKEFVMKERGIRKNLPLDQAVEIQFTPTESGELRYACGMDMIAGKVIVK